MTTKDIVKILSFDEDFKTTLLNQLDSLSPDQKFTIEQLLWKTYASAYRLRLDQNLELALLRAGDNREPLDRDFYKREYLKESVLELLPNLHY